MHFPARLPPIALPALLVGLAACASTGERQVAFDSLPAPARNALLEQANRAPITRVVSERRDGVTCYEGRWTRGSAVHEATVAASGTLLETESQVSAPQVPLGVPQAAERALGNSAPISYEKKTDVSKGKVTFSAEARRGAETVEVEFSPDGTRRSGEEAGEESDSD